MSMQAARAHLAKFGLEGRIREKADLLAER